MHTLITVPTTLERVMFYSIQHFLQFKMLTSKKALPCFDTAVFVHTTSRTAFRVRWSLYCFQVYERLCFDSSYSPPFKCRRLNSPQWTRVQSHAFVSQRRSCVYTSHFYSNARNLDDTVRSKCDSVPLPGRGQTKDRFVSPPLLTVTLCGSKRDELNKKCTGQTAS